MTKTDHKDVRALSDGGDGVPIPLYLCQYRGHTLHVFKKGETQKALDWIEGRDRYATVVSKIDGVEREVARGTEPAPLL